MLKLYAAIKVSVTLFAVGAAMLSAGAHEASYASKGAMPISDLRQAVVPAYCQMPRQRLRHNMTARKYLPKQGSINLDRPGRPIYAQLRPGRPVLVATYFCTAGGVGWPQVVVAYSPQGRLIDALYLYHYGHQDEATVTGWRAVGHSVRMHWRSYEGAGFHIHRHHSRILLDQGRLALNPIR